ncbi:MAG: hypothetical protein J6Y02_14595 [Pseudobutyrivibrio sp.]|nr:hypothetical protein [Pseudobutyrivibrio sp.]
MDTNWHKSPVVLTDNTEAIYMKRTIDDIKAQYKIVQGRLGTLEKKSGKFDKALTKNDRDIERLISVSCEQNDTIREQLKLYETTALQVKAMTSIMEQLQYEQDKLSDYISRLKTKIIVCTAGTFLGGLAIGIVGTVICMLNK